MSSHAQIGPQGAEKQLRKVFMVGGWYGGDYEEDLDLIEGFLSKIFMTIIN